MSEAYSYLLWLQAMYGKVTGDWSKFTETTGHSVNVVSMGNAPSAVVNQLLTGSLDAIVDAHTREDLDEAVEAFRSAGRALELIRAT